MSPAHKQAPLALFCAFAWASPSFRACRILRLVGSAMACNARSREDSLDDMVSLAISRKSMGVNVSGFLRREPSFSPRCQTRQLLPLWLPVHESTRLATRFVVCGVQG